jgi:hypothetical protein
MLGVLDAALEEFSGEWVWDDGSGGPKDGET